MISRLLSHLYVKPLGKNTWDKSGFVIFFVDYNIWGILGYLDFLRQLYESLVRQMDWTRLWFIVDYKGWEYIGYWDCQANYMKHWLNQMVWSEPWLDC